MCWSQYIICVVAWGWLLALHHGVQSQRTDVNIEWVLYLAHWWQISYLLSFVSAAHFVNICSIRGNGKWEWKKMGKAIGIINQTVTYTWCCMVWSAAECCKCCWRPLEYNIVSVCLCVWKCKCVSECTLWVIIVRRMNVCVYIVYMVYIVVYIVVYMLQ